MQGGILWLAAGLYVALGLKKKIGSKIFKPGATDLQLGVSMTL